MKKIWSCLYVIWSIHWLVFASPSFAINGGAAVANANARPPHRTVGATVWQNQGVPLQEPCTAVLMCENVILTAVHCLNFNPQGDMYFTLAEDTNALAAPMGMNQANRYQRVANEYNRMNQTTTARIDKNTVQFGEVHNYPVGAPGQVIPTGLAMAAFRGNDTLAGLTYPDLVPQNFALAQDRNAFNRMGNTFLNPGNAATQANVAGYGDNAAMRAGAGALRKGTMRFLSWINPNNGLPQGMQRPAANNINGFLLQFSRGQDNNAHGCPGDSGGPAFYGGMNADRLGGILDIISDRPCTNRDPQNPQNPPQIPHINNYVSLIYSANRTFIQTYMNTHCSDRRSINLKTGDNYVRPEEEEQEEEDWSCTPDSEDIYPWVSIDDYYYDFFQGWMDFMITVFPNHPWFPVVPPDPSVFPSPLPNYCSAPNPTPEPSPTVEPSPSATPEPSPTLEPSPSATPEPSPTVEPSPSATPEPSPTVEPSPSATPEPSPTVETSPSATPEGV